MIYFVLAVLLILVAVVVLAWRVARRKRALRIFMHRSQQLTDLIVNRLFQQLDWPITAEQHSVPVADVWGHGIMAFTYDVPTPTFAVTRQQLNDALAQLAHQADIVSSDPRFAAFVLTDFWQRGGQTHLDVAFVTNAPTIEYVDDLAKV